MRACKKITAVFAVLFTFFAGFSQTGGAGSSASNGGGSASSGGAYSGGNASSGGSSSLNMPSITMPQAPSAPAAPQSPSIGSFYVPGFQNQTVRGTQNTTNATSSSTGTAGEAGTQVDGAGNVGGAWTESGITATEADAKKLAESLAKQNLLTSADISSLYDSGLFGTLSSVKGLSTGLSSAVNAGGNDSAAGTSIQNTSLNSTQVLLNKILANLESLKEGQQNLSPEKQQELNAYQKDSKLFKTRDAKILRFKINGYNIADSVSSVFFSEAEADGTFLFTGDRTYYADGRKRNETFYVLFKAVRSNGSAVTFDVQPSVVQDYENQNSFVYRFSKVQGLRAEKTGNLVVLHSSSADLNVDLLLDIDGER